MPENRLPENPYVRKTVRPKTAHLESARQKSLTPEDLYARKPLAEKTLAGEAIRPEKLSPGSTTLRISETSRLKIASIPDPCRKLV